MSRGIKIAGRRPQVSDAKLWKRMDGETDLEKRLNSFLTCQFIGCKDMPMDECLGETKSIIRIFREYGWSSPEARCPRCDKSNGQHSLQCVTAEKVKT